MRGMGGVGYGGSGVWGEWGMGGVGYGGSGVWGEWGMWAVSQKHKLI